MAFDELELLYQAIASPIGIVVQVSEFAAAQQRLYQARQKAGDPALACLQFRRSPYEPETELWIVKAGQVPAALPSPSPKEQE